MNYDPTQRICRGKYYDVECPNSITWLPKTYTCSNKCTVMTHKVALHMSTNTPLYSQKQKEMDLIYTFLGMCEEILGFIELWQLLNDVKKQNNHSTINTTVQRIKMSQYRSLNL